jgi:hypothetical protein
MKPKKWFVGETGPELSSDEEFREQFFTVRSRKNQKILKRWRKVEYYYEPKYQ